MGMDLYKYTLTSSVDYFQTFDEINRNGVKTSYILKAPDDKVNDTINDFCKKNNVYRKQILFNFDDFNCIGILSDKQTHKLNELRHNMYSSHSIDFEDSKEHYDQFIYNIFKNRDFIKYEEYNNIKKEKVYILYADCDEMDYLRKPFSTIKNKDKYIKLMKQAKGKFENSKLYFDNDELLLKISELLESDEKQQLLDILPIKENELIVVDW